MEDSGPFCFLLYGTQAPGKGHHTCIILQDSWEGLVDCLQMRKLRPRKYEHLIQGHVLGFGGGGLNSGPTNCTVHALGDFGSMELLVCGHLHAHV